MANPDSERKPDDKKSRLRVSGTTYDMVLILLAGVMAAFAVTDVTLVGEGYFEPIPVVGFAAVAILFAYLFYRLSKNRPPRPVGQDFNF